MDKKKINEIKFFDTPNVELKCLKSDSIAEYLQKHIFTLEQRAANSEKEYAATKKFASQIIIKSDSLDSKKSKAIVDTFANSFAGNTEHLSKMGYSEETSKTEISKICGSYISEVSYPEVPASRLFTDEKGNTISIKPHNYIAQFSFRSFCQTMGQAIALRISIGQYDGSEESILGLIVAVVETLLSLANQAAYRFEGNMADLLKTIIAATGAGRYYVSEDNIIKQFQDSGHTDASKADIIKLIDELDSLKVILIENGNITLREKIYF